LIHFYKSVQNAETASAYAGRGQMVWSLQDSTPGRNNTLHCPTNRKCPDPIRQKPLD